MPNETKNQSAKSPIVVVMGHIDHGKSTLLDAIRKISKVRVEAGGITQHVAAYEVAGITFLDTPGHEAFQAIRARGSKVADIAVLVVSAEDGVKQQTLEALNLIKQDKTPFIVAITKVDKPSADIEKVKQSLAENEIYVEGYGGNVPVVPLSAKSGAGIKELLDMIHLVAELEHFVGHKDRLGTGIIIESHLDSKVGVTAVGVIKDGTVKKGQIAASVGAIAPLRFILDIEGKNVDELSFSSPIQIVGWDEVPPVGATFEIFEDKKAAQLYAESEAIKAKARELKKVVTPLAEGEVEILNLPLIIKTDAAGSLEAIEHELKKLGRERIKPRIVLATVGTVSENDVKSALSVAGTTILSFNTKVDAQAKALAERSGIKIETFDIIYKLTEYVETLLEEREPRIEVEEVSGKGKVLKLFSQTKDKQVLGAKVLAGLFEKGNGVRIMRREVEIGRGKIKELQQSKTNVESVAEGLEFGAMVESKIEIAPGDILESVRMVTK